MAEYATIGIEHKIDSTAKLIDSKIEENEKRITELEESITDDLCDIKQSIEDLSSKSDKNLNSLMKYYKENDRRYWQRHETEVGLLRSMQIAIGDIQVWISRIVVLLIATLVLLLLAVFGWFKYSKLLSNYSELTSNYNQLYSEYIGNTDTLEVETEPT